MYQSSHPLYCLITVSNSIASTGYSSRLRTDQWHLIRVGRWPVVGGSVWSMWGSVWFLHLKNRPAGGYILNDAYRGLSIGPVGLHSVGRGVALGASVSVVEIGGPCPVALLVVRRWTGRRWGHGIALVGIDGPGLLLKWQETHHECKKT